MLVLQVYGDFYPPDTGVLPWLAWYLEKGLIILFHPHGEHERCNAIVIVLKQDQIALAQCLHYTVSSSLAQAAVSFNIR